MHVYTYTSTSIFCCGLYITLEIYVHMHADHLKVLSIPVNMDMYCT
jgi:hypothetical protein